MELISHKDAVSTLCRRYGISAPEASSMLSADKALGFKLSTLEKLHAYYDGLEADAGLEVQARDVYHAGLQLTVNRAAVGCNSAKEPAKPYKPRREPRGPLSILTFNKMSKADQQRYLRKLRDKELQLQLQLAQVNRELAAIHLELYALEPPKATELRVDPDVEAKVRRIPEKTHTRKPVLRLTLASK